MYMQISPLFTAAANLAEQQRALATLGRTYWVQSTSDEVGEEGARELRLHAGNAYLRSLDVCDKLGGLVPDRWVFVRFFTCVCNCFWTVCTVLLLGNCWK